MPLRPHASLSAFILACGLSACGAAPADKPKPPATVEAIGHETELMRVTLTAEAVQRLGLATEATGTGQQATLSRTVPGEIVAAPRGGGLPVAAGTDLAALAGLQARADADAQRAVADLKLSLIHI